MPDAGAHADYRKVTVLCYHALGDLRGAHVVAPYGVPLAAFRRQIEFLSRFCTFIGGGEFVRFLEGHGVPKRAVLLTFDDCYADLVDGSRFLAELSIPAVAFAVTGRIGGTNTWDEEQGAPQLRLADVQGLATAAKHGIAIGSHSRTHPALTRLTDAELADELHGSRDDLRALPLETLPLLAYPYGLNDDPVRKEAARAGYVGAFTVRPGLATPLSDPFALPRIQVKRSDRLVGVMVKLALAAARGSRG